MSGKITSEDIVGEPVVDGRPLQVQRITWAGTDGRSYDLIDPQTGACLTDVSFDEYPSEQQIRDVLATSEVETP